jgi:zinc transport system substrate-binding protein
MDRKYIAGVIFGIVFIGFLTLMVNQRNSVSTVPLVSSGKLRVMTSFYPLYFFANQIGGDKADVKNITPAGAEPHDYEPTPSDIASIENSNLLILNGGGLEVWGEDIKKNIDTKNTLVVIAGENLTNQQVMEDGENIIDPHIWLAPPLASLMVDKIVAGFISTDPTNKDYYQMNANKFKAELATLDTEYKQGLTNCASKDIVTSHAAFGYLSTIYGLHQVPISGLSPDAEPSPKQLADVADFVKKNKVQYIFFESLVSPKLSETIARETGTKTRVLDPIEGITPEDIAKGDNYMTVMRINLQALETVLQCK